jgi:uncharacterized protein involved in exopolysaccharide biosynthesis
MQVGTTTTLLVAGLGLLVGIGLALLRRFTATRARERDS